MRLARWTVALGLLAAATSIAAPLGTPFAPPAARADDAADKRAASAAAQDLASADETVRTTAARRLAELGRTGAEEVARRGAGLDDRAWRACAEAFVRAKCSWCALAFVTAARGAPPKQATRLLDLAHALDPLAGVHRTREETASEVRRLLEEASQARCSTGYEEEIALLGHDAIEPLLAGMRDGAPDFPGGSVSCAAVALLAEKGDLPAIRELILAGRVNLASAVARMQREGVREATDLLLDAAAAGRLESRVTEALGEAPDAARVRKALDSIVEKQPAAADRARANLAGLFVSLGARESIPRLESWIATSSRPEDFVAIADALVHFGDPKGVGVLVRIAGESLTRFPCRPSTPEELAAASAPGRLCPQGFSPSDRERAAQKLSAIAGKDVFDFPEDWVRRKALQDQAQLTEAEYLARAATAFRTWWEASKDTLRYDVAARRWTVGG